MVRVVWFCLFWCSFHNSFGFHTILPYLKWLWTCEYQTIMMYSGLAFILLRAWMYYIFCIVLVFICYAYLSSLPLSWIIIPRDLYVLVIVNSLICFMRFCLSGGFWSPIIIILDLFLLIDIPFSSAHFSAILIVFISF